MVIIIIVFLEEFISLFLERGERREKEREKNINQLPLADLARNPGMCPDWESNQRPFGFQADTQSTDPQQPGLIVVVIQRQARVQILTQVRETCVA